MSPARDGVSRGERLRTLPTRSGVFWWLYVCVLAGAALFIAHSFVGILVLGLFGYYATRPIAARFEERIDSKRLAAGLAALTVLVPVIAITLYAGVRAIQQIQRQFEGSAVAKLVSDLVGFDVETNGPAALLREPPSLDRMTELLTGSAVQQGLAVLDAVFGTILLVSLAVTLSYALLVYDEAISRAFANVVGGREETVYAYGLAVDSDLESIFFGNFLFVLVMSVLATATYAVTNLVAPAGQIPMVFTLGVLTGIASLIPIVVGKVIYVPIVAYLAVTPTRDGSGQFVFAGVLLVVYFVVLDIIPQSLIQPYISGRQLNPIILLFAYVLGPLLFGWYGFFLLPIVFVLMFEAVRIVVPELLHGEPIGPEPEVAEESGARSTEMQDTGTEDDSSEGGEPEMQNDETEDDDAGDDQTKSDGNRSPE